MSYVPAVARLMQLTARRSDVVDQQRLVGENIRLLIAVGSRLISLDLDPNPLSPFRQELTARQRAIENQEKALNLTLRRLEAENLAIDKELEAINKVVQKAVEAFKTFG